MDDEMPQKVESWMEGLGVVTRSGMLVEPERMIRKASLHTNSWHPSFYALGGPSMYHLERPL